MNLRFPKISPPAGYSHFGKFFIDIPEPIPGFRFKNVYQAGVSKVKIKGERLAFSICSKHIFASTASSHLLEVVRIKGSVTRIVFTPSFASSFDHFFRFGKRIPVKIQGYPWYLSSHSKPIEINDHGINRNGIFLEFLNGFKNFLPENDTQTGWKNFLKPSLEA
jgi:hypothetical protein